MKKFHFIFYLCACFGFFSCQQKQEPSAKKDLSQQQVTEKLLEANKSSIVFENKQIDSLVNHSGWKMTQTPTGLRYEVLVRGKGEKSKSGKLARIEYEVKEISGEVIYSSERTGPKEFRIGSGGVESGLEEGILLLRIGDEARFVLPSYLAFGLSGDQNLIPPKTTLIYTLKLIDLK